MTATATRHDWTLQEARELFNLPFNDLLFRAQSIHREHFDPNEVQVSTLLSIKTGACPEDCKYCPQSGHYNTGLEKEKLLEIEKVVAEARVAREKGASRFCIKERHALRSGYGPPGEIPGPGNLYDTGHA